MKHIKSQKTIQIKNVYDQAHVRLVMSSQAVPNEKAFKIGM